MGPLVTGLAVVGEMTELMVWGAICAGLLLGLFLRIGQVMRQLISWLFHHNSYPRTAHPRLAILFLASALAAQLSAATTVAAGQGWWWGSPINPGFDRNTVIQVAGTATQVDIVARGGPSTLRLDTSTESFTVMLGPGWYLTEIRADIRPGDPLTVEGSKMMDRRGSLHLVAAKITNQRTGVVLTLRDEAGRPLWMSGGPSGRMQR
jgi:hypothetical protein